MIDNSKEYILCAAIRRKESRGVKPYHEGANDLCSIEIGYRHHDIIQRFKEELDVDEQGFYTSRGRYVDRNEAMRIAYECGQVAGAKALRPNYETNEIGFWSLFSEDLY